MNIEFSLDCELLWGMPEGINEEYIKNNIENDEAMLAAIVEGWKSSERKLYIAFVLNTIPNKIGKIYENKITAKIIEKYKINTPKTEYSNQMLRIIENSTNKNIGLGVHSVSHCLYNEMPYDRLTEETREIEKFINAHKEYKGIMVFPKNIINHDLMPKYMMMFTKIRVNSRSWLYKTNGKGVSPLRRILRYLDSFLPIYEIFCDKRAEYEGNNVIVGTHFYRANLSKGLLMIHIFRLHIGIFIMKVLGWDVHIWSHPHNFTNKHSVDAFIKLTAK